MNLVFAVQQFPPRETRKEPVNKRNSRMTSETRDFPWKHGGSLVL